VPGTFHVNTLFVQPAHRQQGIGKALLERLMTDARAAGYTRFQLWVHTGNLVARRLYERSGFTEQGLPCKADGGESIIRYVC
jgi:ribosomal protein S18 acetylase RimI-like enzyme